MPPGATGLQNAGTDAALALGCRGFFATVTTDIWHYVALYGEPIYGMWVMGAAWNARHFIEHFEFTQDCDFLITRAYPMLRECGLFLLDWLSVDPDTGKLISGPGVSAENRFFDTKGNKCTLTMGCCFDQEIIWDVFTNLLTAAEILHIDDEFIKEVRKAIANLKLPSVGSDGRLLEWAEEFKECEPGHRHVSHLYGIMPGNRISLDRTPELAEAVRRSVDGRLSDNYDAQGWSLGWIAAILARLREGDRALSLIDDSFPQELYPNLFVAAHTSVQVGDMMGVAAAVTELLLQSQNGEIHLLPALPSAWPKGRVTGLRARGAFEVDIEWDNCELKRAEIQAHKAGFCRIRYRDRIEEHDLPEGAKAHFTR